MRGHPTKKLTRKNPAGSVKGRVRAKKESPKAKEEREASEREGEDERIRATHGNSVLLPQWVLFIDAYFKHRFNGTKAYMEVYQVKSEKVARSAAARLLSYVSVDEEIKYRLEAMRITDDAVAAEMWDIARAPHLRTEKGSGAQVSALRNLAEMKGLIKKDQSTVNVFTADNPPYLMMPFSPDREKELGKQSKNNIVE